MASAPSMERPSLSSASRATPAEQTPAVTPPSGSWKLRVFFGVQIVLAILLFAVEVPRLQGHLEILLILIALNVAAELAPINVYGDSYISYGFVFTIAMIVIFGPAGVILAAPIEATAGRLADLRKVDHISLTNSARFVIVYWAGAAAYGLFAAYNPESVNLDVIAGAAAATIVCYTLSAVFLSVSLTLRTGTRPWSAWVEHGRWVAPHYAAMGIIGLALAAAYIALGLPGMVAFVVPAVMMRLAMKQYVAKTEENVEKLKVQNAALQSANVQIMRVSDELRQSYDSTLEALVNALDARDQETKGHSLRVSRYMMDIAREMGIAEGSQAWLDMQRGSLLHDVGKIGVSDTILLKPGKLTDDEWTLMRMHPEIGYNMLRQVKFLEGAAEIILSHHERWDGKGYPRGLHEDEIPLGGRIFAVVDTFDSMTSDRPYRKALSTLESLNEILRCSGSQFDPLVVEAFLDIYDQWIKEREELHGDDVRRVA